jgi:hypothetical protein
MPNLLATLAKEHDEAERSGALDYAKGIEYAMTELRKAGKEVRPEIAKHIFFEWGRGAWGGRWTFEEVEAQFGNPFTNDTDAILSLLGLPGSEAKRD